MKIALLSLVAFFSVFPARTQAAGNDCASYAELLKTAWRLDYERADGPSRTARLDKSECSIVFVTYAPRDMDGYDGTEYPEPRLRFWSESGPYEIVIEISGGMAQVVLMKRDGPRRSQMARIDQLAENELATTTIDYTGDVLDAEYPLLRSGRGVRKIVRAARVLLTPRKH